MERVKLFLFAGGITLYLEEFIQFTRKLLDLINTLSKETGYNTNIKESVVFLCIFNTLTEKEILEGGWSSIHNSFTNNK